MFRQFSSLSLASLVFWASCERSAVQPDWTPGPERTTLLEHLCEGGSSNDCYRLGYKYQYGQGVEQSTIKSGAYYRRACKLGLSIACPNGRPPEKPARVAEQETIDACKEGQNEDCARLSAIAMRYLKENNDGKRAAELWFVTCGRGDSAGCYNLGLILEAGEQTKGAAVAFRAACKLQDADGCLKIAQILSKSSSKEDQQQATDFYFQACNGEVKEGCQGLDKSLRTRCDEDRDYLACGQYAVWLAVGKGRPPDTVRSHQYAVKACRGGHQESCQFAKEGQP